MDLFVHVMCDCNQSSVAATVAAAISLVIISNSVYPACISVTADVQVSSDIHVLLLHSVHRLL